MLKNGWLKFSELPQLYRNHLYLEENEDLKTAIHIELSNRKGEYIHTKLFLLDYEEFRRIIKRNFPQIRTRKDYESAREKKLLPQGMPARPDSVYKEFRTWRHFHGLNLVTDYEEAKRIIRPLGIKTKQEFYDKRKKAQSGYEEYYPLLQLYGDPGNQHSGGYDKWAGWPDFLGISSD